MGLLSFAGDLLGGFLGNEAAEDRQNDAQAFSAQQYATRYQTQVADMKAAGLNPMLAYLNPATGQPSSQGGSVVPYGNLGSNWAAADRDVSSARQAESQASLNEAMSNVADQTAEKISVEVKQTEALTDQAKAVTRNLAETFQNLVKEGYNLTEQGNVMRATVDKLRAEVPNIREALALIQNQVSSEAGRALLYGFDVKAAQDMGNVGRSMGQLEPFFRMLSSVLRFSR